jgi:hypothetical protein
VQPRYSHIFHTLRLQDHQCSGEGNSRFDTQLNSRQCIMSLHDGREMLQWMDIGYKQIMSSNRIDNHFQVNIVLVEQLSQSSMLKEDCTAKPSMSMAMDFRQSLH